MARAFKWDSWNYDFDGDAYIIAKDQCPSAEDVPEFICREDGISRECKPEMVVEEGWCAFQVRSDWENYDGPHGSYLVEKQKEPPKDKSGKKKPGWFPVWIVRKDEWY